MYCKKCGKFIDGAADVCDECLAQESAATPVAPAEPVNVGSRKVGLKKAIFATVFMTIASLFFSFLSSTVADGFYINSYESLYISRNDLAMCIVWTAMTIAFALPSMLTAISAVKMAKKEVAEGRLNPIATRILGLISMISCIVYIAFSLGSTILAIVVRAM